MKLKSLVPLIIIFALIVVVGIVKEVTKHRPDIAETTGVVSLAPEDMSGLARIEMYPGADPTANLTLACQLSLGTWHVATHMNAPVRSEAINEYLNAVGGLKGEPRTVAASEADLEQYGLTDEKAFHIAGYKEDSTEPMFHWLIGKSPGGLSVFMRRAGDMQVLVETKDLRRMAGIHEIPEDGMVELNPSFWLDKVILRIAPDYIMKIALTYPDKTLTFAKVPKTSEAGEEQPADAHAQDEPGHEGHDHHGHNHGNSDSSEPVYEWALTEGGPGLPFNFNGLNLLLQDFSPTNSSGFVDPANMAEWNLENPVFKCDVEVWDRPDVNIHGGSPDPSEGGYMRVLGPQADYVYKCNVIQFQTIFRQGSDFFDLPGLTLDKDLIRSVLITQPKGDIALSKDGNTWSLAKPEGGYRPDIEVLDTMLAALASWKPDDYADEGTDIGEPTHTVTVTTLRDSHTITLYKPSPCVPGYYARLDDNPLILAMGSEDMDKIFINASEIIDHTVLGVEEGMLSEIYATNNSGTCSLLKIDNEWRQRQGDQIITYRTSILDSIGSITAGMRADSVIFSEKKPEMEPELNVIVRTKEGKEYTIFLYPEQDEVHVAAVDGRPLLYKVPHKNVKDYLQVINMVINPDQPLKKDDGSTAGSDSEQELADELEKVVAEQAKPAATAEPAEAESPESTGAEQTQ